MALDPTAPIGPQLHAILRDRIVRNRLAPGSRISETEVARQFSISRQPVRETFIKLSEEGLIDIRPQRSTVIRKIDPSTVLDARFVREAVEADIVRLLAQSPDPRLVAELRAQLADQDRIAKEAPDEFIRADEKFHFTLADGAGKGNVWHIIQGLKSQMDRVRFLSFGLFSLDRLMQQHRDIVDRIEQGDVAGAETATRHHLRAVLSDLPDIIRANPDVFTTPNPDDVSPTEPTHNTLRRTP